MTERDTCKTCKWYRVQLKSPKSSVDGFPTDVTTVLGWGNCYRYPPVMAEDRMYKCIRPERPIVNEIEACGEYSLQENCMTGRPVLRHWRFREGHKYLAVSMHVFDCGACGGTHLKVEEDQPVCANSPEDRDE